MSSRFHKRKKRKSAKAQKNVNKRPQAQNAQERKKRPRAKNAQTQDAKG